MTGRIASESLRAKIKSAQDAAALITNGMTVA
jgi:hypothetical protein